MVTFGGIATEFFFQAVSELPRPNRDTLAFLILHLQKVADSPDCMMPADNLAKVMGPTIVGYSSRFAAYVILVWF